MKKIGFFLMLFLVISSCSKSEIELLSGRAWYLQSFKFDGQELKDSNPYYTNHEWSFKTPLNEGATSGTLTISNEHSAKNYQYDYNPETGTLTRNDPADTSSTVYVVTEITDDFLKLNRTEANSTYIIEFIR